MSTSIVFRRGGALDRGAGGGLLGTTGMGGGCTRAFGSGGGRGRFFAPVFGDSSSHSSWTSTVSRRFGGGGRREGGDGAVDRDGGLCEVISPVYP
jgi:hypothetical protein